MWLKELAAELVSKYGTSDPVKLCEILGIMVISWNIGEETNGFYHYCRRNKFIYINDSLDYPKKIYVIAHELAHAILHPRINATFTKNVHWSNLSKIELQAHRLATYLLLSDVDKTEYSTLQELFSDLGIPDSMQSYI